jgi:P-type Cu+ transporter
MATDPVCGMEVDEQEAPYIKLYGKPYYFCSMACKRSFEEDPEKYLDDSDALSEQNEAAA